jgi:hypothetical protein
LIRLRPLQERTFPCRCCHCAKLCARGADRATANGAAMMNRRIRFPRLLTWRGERCPHPGFAVKKACTLMQLKRFQFSVASHFCQSGSRSMMISGPQGHRFGYNTPSHRRNRRFSPTKFIRRHCCAAYAPACGLRLWDCG